MSPNLKSVLDKLASAELPSFEGVEFTGPNIKSVNFGDTPLHIMAVWGDTDSIRILVNEGAELEARGENNFTPLLFAVQQGKIEAVRLLLEFGANPYARASDGDDAFSLAEILGHNNILTLLNGPGNRA